MVTKKKTAKKTENSDEEVLVEKPVKVNTAEIVKTNSDKVVDYIVQELKVEPKLQKRVARRALSELIKRTV